MERWVLVVSTALAAACPAAIMLQGQPWWVILLSFLGTAAAAASGALGISKPADAAKLAELREAPALYDRHE